MKKVVLNVVKYLAVYFVIQIVMTLFAMFLVSFVAVLNGGDASGVVTDNSLLGLASLLANITALVVFLRMRWSSLTLGIIRKQEVITVLLLTALLALAYVVLETWVLDQLNLPDWLADEFTSSMNDFWGIVGICVGAPLVEELVFRGAVQRELRARFGAWTAILLSAAIFGLIHGNPIQVVGAFMMGILLGWLYERTGSVWLGVVAHCANNTFSTVLAQFYPVDASLEEMTGGGWLMYGLLFVSTLVAVVLLFTLNEHFRQMRRTSSDSRIS